MSISVARSDAYRALGVTVEETLAQPQITPQLRAITRTIKRAGQQKVTHRVRGEKGDRREIVEDTQHAAPYGPGSDLTTAWPFYLAASDDPDIQRLVTLRRRFPESSSWSAPARVLPIEAFCVAAKVSPLRVLEVLVGILVRQSAQASTIIAAVSHPRIVQKTIDIALTDGGVEDRATLHKAVNFLPTPKGNTTIINNAPSASASAHATAAAQAALAPPPEQTIRRLSDRFNEARLLPQPAPTAPIALPEASVIAVPFARFGDAPARFAVPSRVTAPTPPSAPSDPPEEEEDERDG